MTSKASPKDPVLSPTFVNSTTLSITINPDDKVQFTTKNGQQRWAKVRQHLMEFLLTNEKDFETLKLYPDISFPQPLGGGRYPRIHWHGFVKFKNVINFLTNFTSTSHYMIDIDTMDDKAYWKAYSKKFIKEFSNYSMYSITLQDLIDMKPQMNPPQKTNILDFCKDYD